MSPYIILLKVDGPSKQWKLTTSDEVLKDLVFLVLSSVLYSLAKHLIIKCGWFCRRQSIFSDCNRATRRLLPSWKRLGAGLGGGGTAAAAVAAAGLFRTSGGGGGGAGLGGRSQAQGILTWGGTAAAAAGSRGSARRGGRRRRVTGDGPATVLHPVGRELDLVCNKDETFSLCFGSVSTIKAPKCAMTWS